MDEYDHADLDGDGEFDAIDISIMEDEEENKQPVNRKSGCCVVLFLLGSSIGAGMWIGYNLI